MKLDCALIWTKLIKQLNEWHVSHVTYSRHVIPTLDELRYDLNGAKVFLKLNLNKGFHHLELDEDSVALQHFQHMLA